ncbi:hypothetical protein ACOQFV_24715 [Nocardiopsis changdeensis]|uniref:Uncharacterized protein n=1 Tax=Nocardiopsis changdeensis TaxID=2831969 RepID=A0A975KUT1_9ACTN|nr:MULTISPECIES: hypothetical protein [Nocardiopsis]QUX26406.1 hypothetical protein KGD84_32425 [Nocardiopsis changdeensis]QYX40678.1 hypothetical protein K1J57_32275 [Nocardiopsis sp. MT53]
MFGRLSRGEISGINEDGATCWCGADIVSGTSKFEKRTSGPDLYVRELTCANSHVETRKSDGG